MIETTIPVAGPDIDRQVAAILKLPDAPYSTEWAAAGNVVAYLAQRGIAVESSNRYRWPWRVQLIAPTFEYIPLVQGHGATFPVALCYAVIESAQAMRRYQEGKPPFSIG